MDPNIQIQCFVHMRGTFSKLCLVEISLVSDSLRGDFYFRISVCLHTLFNLSSLIILLATTIYELQSSLTYVLGIGKHINKFRYDPLISTRTSCVFA